MIWMWPQGSTPKLWVTPFFGGRRKQQGWGWPKRRQSLSCTRTLVLKWTSLVANVDEALERFKGAGGETVTGPFDIPIGRCAVVRDPFGNAIVMLDQTKGHFVTKAAGEVIRVEKS